jgi:hypothetical protein
MEDDASDAADSWHHHPFTQGILEKHKELRKEAVERLIAAARGSSDLRVFQFWASLDKLDSLIELLSGKGKKK